MEKTYQINRYYQNNKYITKVMRTGLTLEEAQKWCNDPETSSRTCIRRTNVEFFDGYVEE